MTRAGTSFFAAPLFVALALTAAGARAQPEPIVLIVDPGEARVNVAQLGTAISQAIGHPLVRMTDDAARTARGRLTIAFQGPDRWVLRYELAGAVAWISDRIRRPGELRTRLAAMSRDLVAQVAQSQSPATRPAPRPRTGNGNGWDTDAIIVALQNEIVDPFAGDPPRASRPVTVLWSEVIDPFTDRPPRASVAEVWSEVIDPWASAPRR